MIKMLLGAAVVVALVGYGILTPETLEDAGARMKQGINNGAAWVKEKTDPSAVEKTQEFFKND